MTIAQGTTLGPYQILGHLGQGGMGEVWRARDSRIGRDVAVKVLPASFGDRDGDERLRRFEQEARAAGALNHPGLVTIFDFGTTGSQPYIVMELLEGQTLRDVISRGAPLPLRRAVDYGVQIASALAVAHEKGIIHRDLKPENIFITADGRVKILDFGLAKLAEEEPGDQDKTAPYPKLRLTSAGVVVGTPGYMSPEQARGKTVDHRTDIFSLGTVLYEMLSGAAPFDRETAVETMHAIVTVDPPPLTTRDPKMPAALDAIVAHCLEKNPRERCQSARELGFELKLLHDVQQTASGIEAAPPPRKPWRAAAIAAVALLIVAAAAYLGRMNRGKADANRRVFKQLTFADGLEILPALSPDGKLLAYVAGTSGRRDIYVQRVDGFLATNLTADSQSDDSEPAFSPDGSLLAFRSERDGGGIFVMGVTGESVRRLTDFGHNPSWSPDGTRLAVSTVGAALRPQMHELDGDLWIVDANSGAKRPVVKARTPEFGGDALQPSWSPHGNRIAFWGVASQPRGQREVWTVDPDAPRPATSIVRVSSDASIHWNPVWSPDGQYLYYGSNRDGTMNLWRVPIDEANGKTRGAPEPLSLPGATNGNFSFSRDGDMVYTAVVRSHHVLTASFDPATPAVGELRPLLAGQQQLLSFEPSPDRQTVAFTTGSVQEDLFVANPDGSRLRQLTNDPARDRAVTWSPDGITLYFHSNRDGAYQIWSIRADGSGLTCVTSTADLQRIGARNVFEPNASPDGRTLAAQAEPDVGVLIHLDRPAGRRLEPLDRHLNSPRWSPDGKRLIGTFINDAQSWDGIALYSLATRRVERILDRGDVPQWLPDGKRVVFFDNDTVGVLDVDTRTVRTRQVTLPAGMEWDGQRRLPYLAPDGSMLYLHKTAEQGDIWMFRVEKNDGGR